jgi:hypothetical protein
VRAKHNPLRAVVMLGQDIFRMAACAAAENPPSLLAIATSAAIGFVLHALHARPVLGSALRLE